MINEPQSRNGKDTDLSPCPFLWMELLNRQNVIVFPVTVLSRVTMDMRCILVCAGIRRAGMSALFLMSESPDHQDH
jgi:hypothetical protein